jgi:hypothetical protein
MTSCRRTTLGWSSFLSTAISLITPVQGGRCKDVTALIADVSRLSLPKGQCHPCYSTVHGYSCLSLNHSCHFLSMAMGKALVKSPGRLVLPTTPKLTLLAGYYSEVHNTFQRC